MTVVNGANTLLLIRDRKATNLRALCAHFEIDPTGPQSYYVTHVLDDLHQAGLILGSPATHSSWVDVELSTTAELARVQSTLGFSLSELARSTPDSVTITPFFGRPRPLQDSHDVFVLMPFSQAQRPIYDDHLLKVINAAGLSAKRADDFFTTGHVITDVWRGIWSAKVVIADCTGRNPNVFYEIGVAHTIGRPVILITQSEDDIPFDLRHIRYIPYHYTPPGMSEFERRLATTLRQELAAGIPHV
jgi:hypothetical protein